MDNNAPAVLDTAPKTPRPSRFSVDDDDLTIVDSEDALDFGDDDKPQPKK